MIDDPHESDVKFLLTRGLGDEPPVRVTRDDILAGGRRRQRRQRAAAVAGVTLAAAAVITVTSFGASGLLGSAPLTPATKERPAPMTTTTTAAPSHQQRLGEALRVAPIRWPAEITRRTGESGPHWYDFRHGDLPSVQSTGYEANIRLDTPSGYRWLSIDVFQVAPGDQAPACIGAQSGRPLPDCTRQRLPDGSTMRTDIEKPTDPSLTTIAFVVEVRPDGTRVEVMETSSEGDGSRQAQLLPTGTLITLAQLPGLTAS